ncbi:MAG: UvrD-helicase domain-containing protein, partial [Acidobacteria bacterium]|nr:UvrD-helicase domain-containing protein [Acidobacteriota bacterium]
MSLSPKQRAAATRTGQDVCVVAGPGSGKTRVLIHRFAWLVRGQHIPAGRILAITFTEKAATEIKKRLVAEFASDPGTRAQIERAYVSTVHGFCARLLKENAIAAGVDPAFGVLLGPESQEELNAAATTVLDALFVEDPAGMRSLLNAVQVTTLAGSFAPDLVGALLGVYEALRIAGQDPAQLPALPRPGLSAREPLETIQSLLALNLPTNSPAKQQRLESLRRWVDRARALPDAPLSAAHFALWSDSLCNLRGLRPPDPVSAAVKHARELMARLRIEFIGAYHRHERAL